MQPQISESEIEHPWLPHPPNPPTPEAVAKAQFVDKTYVNETQAEPDFDATTDF